MPEEGICKLLLEASQSKGMCDPGLAQVERRRRREPPLINSCK
jgi:hypothetical protein